jgi:hypothetical protein
MNSQNTIEGSPGPYKQSGSDASPGEQVVCLSCGFCCDGTLFRRARLKREEKGNLPLWIEAHSHFSEDDGYFALPCGYFESKCMIYHLKRAFVCSEFRCQLLGDLNSGRISRDEAMQTVSEARLMRDDLLRQFRRLSGRKGNFCLRDVLSELGKMQSGAGANFHEQEVMEAFRTRCNIFEALLIRHFRSEKDFDDMVMR